jgi:hypothetical protein
MMPAPASEIAAGMKIIDFHIRSPLIPSAKRAIASPTMTTNRVPPTTQVNELNRISRVPLPEKISL